MIEEFNVDSKAEWSA